MPDEQKLSFAEVVAAWLAREAQGPLRDKVAALRAAYEAGATSSTIDLAAYLTVRAPATHAAITAALGEVARLAPGFAPASLIDAGAGPGTASFAAAARFPSLQQAVLVEADARFAAAAAELTAALPLRVSLLRQSLLSALPRAELVVAAYVLAELPLPQMADAARHLWRAAEGVLVLVEPGTPQGFARLRGARSSLLAQGAHIIGPCTHEAACPMQGDDWCHFKARLQRSRAHMHAKGGLVPFEDEAYAWLALARFAVPRERARIVGPPRAGKVAVELRTCSSAGLRDEVIASRDKPTYKRARKLVWGDGFSQ